MKFGDLIGVAYGSWQQVKISAQYLKNYVI